MTTSAAKSDANGSSGNNNSNNSNTATTTGSPSSSSSSATAAATNCNGVADSVIMAGSGPPLVAGASLDVAAAGEGDVAVAMTGTVGGVLAAVAAAAAAATPRAMQSDEDFNIRFVNLVRAHRCLYDKKVPEYRNRDNQEKAWTLISHETRESVIHCKERWRNLRACLSRYIKQQSSSDPQHKPYYLTEHMAFLLPFLKSTRNCLENGIGHFVSANHNNNNNNNHNNNSLATLFQISQQHLQHGQALGLHGVGVQLLPAQAAQLQYGDQLELKHSLSDNEDEETIDAFDPAITASMHQHRQQQQQLQQQAQLQQQQQQQQQQQHLHGARSPAALSDTASANTMQNFIPDVQLAELPEGTAGQATDYASAQHAGAHQHHHYSRLHTLSGSHPHSQHPAARSDDYDGHEPKRIKTEPLQPCQDTAHLSMYSAEHSDMEFFRSILPDLAALTPTQKRKFKIGILELIDDVVERYPVGAAPGAPTTTSTTAPTSSSSSSGYVASKQRRSSAREWRK